MIKYILIFFFLTLNFFAQDLNLLKTSKINLDVKDSISLAVEIDDLNISTNGYLTFKIKYTNRSSGECLVFTKDNIEIDEQHLNDSKHKFVVNIGEFTKKDEIENSCLMKLIKPGEEYFYKLKYKMSNDLKNKINNLMIKLNFKYIPKAIRINELTRTQEYEKPKVVLKRYYFIETDLVNLCLAKLVVE